MKRLTAQLMLLAPLICACLLFASGCGSKEEATPPAPNEPAKPAAAPAADAQKLATPAQQAATQAVDALTAQAATAKDALATAAKAQGLIDTAKRLTGENKWSEALKILNDLASYKLTPEQQTLVDNLKAEAQKQLEALAAKKAADEAGKAVGGLLKPKN
jgi:hypothetical protein